MTKNNFVRISVAFAVRQSIEATWLNDRDQFLFPNDGWQADYEFQNDCLVYTLFHGQNRISVEGCEQGVNHWIPFTEAEVNAKEKFKSHFMTDYLSGKLRPRESAPTQPDLFANVGAAFGSSPSDDNEYGDWGFAAPKEHFSAEARAVMDAGRELWRYYHRQPQAVADASFYDIRLHFQGVKTTKSGKRQMNTDSQDERYTELIHTLRRQLKALARKIEPKVYEHGFLKK